MSDPETKPPEVEETPTTPPAPEVAPPPPVDVVAPAPASAPMLAGYRKLITMAIAMVAVVVLAVAAPDQLEKALDGIVWIVGAFMGGSVGEHVARALKR